MSQAQSGRKGARKRKAPAKAPPPPPIKTAPPPPPPRSPLHFERPPIPLVIAVVLTAVLEVLDITIVNVAIPHMLGAFGATSDQITWVLTSYLVSAAVVMPLTGYLSTWLGRRRLLLFAICGFVLTSALCGMAWNLESMVVFRLAQGICGAPLVPLSQAILLDVFPRERHGQALAIFGLGIMVAPVFGPVLGGYLTETYSWRMVFYINVPLGMLALLMSVGYLPQRAIKAIKTDWIGLALLVVAVGALQFILDQGQMRDWFNSRLIVSGTIVTVFATAAFFLRGWNKPDNIIDLSLLKDRNFIAGTLAITAYGISLFGWMALMPLFSQRLLGYPPALAGTLFIPRAVVSAITLALTGSILMSHYSLYADYWGIATPGIWSGIGTGLFFVPLTAAAFASIRKAQYDEASGVYALMRGIGGSAGIAVVSWLFVRQTQIHWNELTAHINPYNPALLPYLAQHGLNPYSPQAAPLVTYEIARQAQMLAFNDLFWFIGVVTLAIIPLIFLMKRPEGVSLVPAH